MRTIGLICFAFISLNMAAQSISLIGGVNHNAFFDREYSGGHSRSAYTPGQGFGMHLAIDDITLEWLPLRFTLGFDNYSGALDVTSGGQGGSYTTEAEVEKSVFVLGVYPLNLKIWEHLRINAGMEFSWLLTEEFSGERYGWSIEGDSYHDNLSDYYEQFSATKYYGLKARMAYDFNITESIAISPQYAFYYGLSGEFEVFPKSTRSMRHYFALGVTKSFGQYIFFAPKE